MNTDRLKEALAAYKRYTNPSNKHLAIIVKAARLLADAIEPDRFIEWCEVHGSVMTTGVFDAGSKVRVCQYAWYSGHAVEACVEVRLAALGVEPGTRVRVVVMESDA